VVTCNGGPAVQLIDPAVDLAALAGPVREVVIGAA
jgi:hypothetical protein